MRFATVSKSLALGFALLMASNVFAATKGSLQISHLLMVNGTTLKPGDYKVEWEGSGSNVEVSIMQGRSVFAQNSCSSGRTGSSGIQRCHSHSEE
jgi:hypothetical protein